MILPVTLAAVLVPPALPCPHGVGTLRLTLVGLPFLLGTPSAAQWRSAAPMEDAARQVLWQKSAVDRGCPAPFLSARALKEKEPIGTRGARVWLATLAGAAAGALLFYATEYPCKGDVMFCEVGFVVYGAGGAALGALVGYASNNGSSP